MHSPPFTTYRSRRRFVPVYMLRSPLLRSLHQQVPKYHLLFEAVLVLLIIRLFFFQKSYKAGRNELTEQEKEELISEWSPEPLVTETDPDDPGLQLFNNNVVSGKMGKMIVVNGDECYNLTSMNFLGMVGDVDVEDASLKCVYEYGVGACGPRGFYGTVDIHLTFEDLFSEFMNSEEAALYPHGFATISSVIPAYSKVSDLIFCDEGVCFSIQKGLQASRSTIIFFKHNDMEDLERLLKIQKKIDIKSPKRASATRKFIVVEGLYINYGDICPLPRLIELKYQYKVRLFLEESISFGVLGVNGRGVTEHFNLDRKNIDFLVASLEYAWGSYGGISFGSKFVVDHQRLGSLGYGFSASLPPFQAAAAITVLNKIKQHPEILGELERNARLMHEQLSQIPGVKVDGESISPIIHIRLRDPSTERRIDNIKLQRVVDLAREKKVALIVARYLEEEEKFLPAPSIRVAVNRAFTRKDIMTCTRVIKEACAAII